MTMPTCSDCGVVKADNRIESLQVTTQAKHVGIHKPMLGKKSKVKRDLITQRFTG